MAKKILKTLTIIKRNRLVNFRASFTEFIEIKKKADKYTEGDVSKWIRYSSLKHNPNKKDFIST